MPVSLTILTLRPIRDVLVDDRPLDDRAGADADVGPAQPLVLLDVPGLLVDSRRPSGTSRGSSTFSPMTDRTPITEFSMTEPRPMTQPSQIRLFLTVAPLIREQGR